MMPPFNLPYFAKKLRTQRESVFFIQVGAMDGKTHDPIHHLVRSQGWRGILVEPLKDHFEKLRENYAGCEGLVFENAAITESVGAGTMFRIPTRLIQEGKIPPWGLGAGSFFPDRNALDWGEIKPHIVQETIPCLTFPDLLKKHQVREFQVLQLDTEGYDYKILRQVNFQKFRPDIVNLEIVNLSKSELAHCKQLLDKHGYLYAKTGYDLLAVSERLLT